MFEDEDYLGEVEQERARVAQKLRKDQDKAKAQKGREKLQFLLTQAEEYATFIIGDGKTEKVAEKE